MNQSLDPLLAIWQSVRHVGENILVCGLVGELFSIFFLEHARKIERRCNIIFTALIILGVAVENIAGGRADDIIRKMRAPRSLTKAQQKAVGKMLQRFGSHESVLFTISDVDPEIAGIMRDISWSFVDGHWKSGFDRFPPYPPTYLRAPMTGILLLVSPAGNRNVIAAAYALRDMLCQDDLETRVSQAFVGTYPPKDDRLWVVIYGK